MIYLCNNTFHKVYWCCNGTIEKGYTYVYREYIVSSSLRFQMVFELTHIKTKDMYVLVSVSLYQYPYL
jgi:hypothetical protein